MTFSVSYTAPTNYAYAGYYYFSQCYGGYWSHYLDVFLPFEENNFDRNFVFNPSYLDANGRTTTGVGGSYNADGSAGLTINSSAQYWNNGNPLDGPFAYQFIAPTVNGAAISPVLATNQTRWLATYPVDSPGSFLLEIGITNDSSYDPPINAMYPNVGNWFGLHYVSAEIGSSGPATTTLYAGNNTTQSGYFYPETVQPQLGVVEYDYWLAQDIFANSFTNGTDFPGMAGLSATHTNSLLITSVGNPAFQLACYAKMAVTNAYPGVYGYLGQYFQQAYQIDSNGNITTNTTGILSPYGNFFATQPGPAALVTMPDIDPPYQNGTCTVYAISLQLDKHHDTNMINTSFNSPDATSLSDPMIFWCNNNFDRWATNSSLFGLVFTDVEQDDQQIAGCPLTPNTPTPDCNYKNRYGVRIIPDTRDLEDFTRLWVCGITSNLLAALPAGSTITLNWGDVGNPNTKNPTIDLFQAADPDGGTGYLTDTNIAAEQVDTADAAYVGRVAPGGSVQLNSSILGGWAGNHFIWCGVSNGTGGLNLTIADSNGNILAQTTAYIQIVDIKQMYERWTVGDNPIDPATNVPYLVTVDLPAGAAAFQYPLPPVPGTPYILHVHGYNMQTWEKDSFAETEYKRLYWQGYQGRFGEFRWPTTVQGYVNATTAFNDSEYNAWRSAPGLLNLLTNLNAKYPGRVYLTAHSHGNVVAGEALRLAGNNQIVNTYIAMQGAVPAHSYDPSTPDRHPPLYPGFLCAILDRWCALLLQRLAGAGTYVNFFNTNDWALTGLWPPDQDLKPVGGFGFESDGVRTNFFVGTLESNNPLLPPSGSYLIFSYCDPAPCFALGAQADVGGTFLNVSGYNQVILPSVWPPDTATPNQPYSTHIWHSAEFRSDNAQRWLFWDMALFQMGIKKGL